MGSGDIPPPVHNIGIWL